MKVALELQPCCGNRSGIGMYTYELARRMQDGEGLEFAGNLFNFMGRNENGPSLQGIDFPLRVCRSMPYGIYRRIWHVLPLTYGMLFPKADLSVFFNYIVPPRVKGRVITTVYDMTYLRFPETMDERNLKRLRQDMAYSVARSDHIITISEFSKREIIELLGVPEEKISVVYCAPSLVQSQGESEDAAEKFGIHGPFLLYVGTIEPRKNLTRLLHAFNLLKQRYRIPHKLVLAGGRGWGNAEIYQTARALLCSDDVIFTGYISSEEKNWLYRHATAFVFPSLYEGFGMPPLEAMSFGCPVVCADAASLPEVVGEAAALVDPTEEESISGGIWHVLSDQQYAETLVRSGYQQIKRFSWDSSAEKLRHICRKVIEKT